MLGKKTSISCDWRNKPQKNKTKPSKNKSVLYKHKGICSWQGIKTERYKQNGSEWSNIIRKTLIGTHNETSKFHLRYFEIASGGRSSFEKHRHEHVVICVKGKGRVKIGRKLHELKPLDILYISPNTPHQLSNPFKNPFGFFCIVNAKRDKPEIIV